MKHLTTRKGEASSNHYFGTDINVIMNKQREQGMTLEVSVVLQRCRYELLRILLISTFFRIKISMRIWFLSKNFHKKYSYKN